MEGNRWRDMDGAREIATEIVTVTKEGERKKERGRCREADMIRDG